MTMVTKRVAPYGEWDSPITADTITSKSWSVTSPRVHRASGRAYFNESTDDGRNDIVEITDNGLKGLLPAPWSAHNSVYEYGGSPYDVLSDGRIIFSDSKAGIGILNPDSGEVVALASHPKLRYSNFSANPQGPWALATEEDHEIDTAKGIRNYVAAVNADTGEVKRVVEGADFYYTPQFSEDGKRVTWIEWNQPDLPFSAGKIFVGDWTSSACVEHKIQISGKDREGAAEPRWGFDGSLFVCIEVDGFRQLHRLAPGSEKPAHIKLKGLENAEFGEIRWFQGSHTYAPLSARHVVAAGIIFGQAKLILIDLETSDWKTIGPENLCAIALDSVVRLSDSSVLVIGEQSTSPSALYKIDVFTGEVTTVRKTTDESLNESLFSKPELVQFVSKGEPSRKVYSILWMPRNPKFIAPEGTLPPLIISSHGGPTSYTGSGLKLRTQYFTTRGYAFLALNYTGSTGHGRDYREALFRNWGTVDADDAAEVADHLVSAGKVGKVGIVGASAGGYNVLQALVRHPKAFGAGFCVCGVSDVKKLDESTHKLESEYMGALILDPGMSEEQKEDRYRERSPLFHAGKIESPLFLLHGVADTVVPVEQARLIYQAVKDKGGDVKIREVPGEGHMFGKPGSPRIWLDEEENWWRKYLL
ncbi:dipeptidyl peptidase (prolyl oligopeptidase) [Colletotrichum truncatum]|uniref:Dipeptidyl peptidase (Prolyl oligopeptidase) n=1 Tax=Colletotrichum truncatum TaxID=5467 RepID=A0ACC3ZH77_COLTU|nr:dipeptidyl peptidase (prolyl oligopeptidase) [Colletotrichum truncatum]KAF6790655.1 dipeptidyl peptidase (prolyl oligopeptidase) [Colletotrichum truncatum]